MQFLNVERLVFILISMLYVPVAFAHGGEGLLLILGLQLSSLIYLVSMSVYFFVVKNRLQSKKKKMIYWVCVLVGYPLWIALFFLFVVLVARIIPLRNPVFPALILGTILYPLVLVAVHKKLVCVVLPSGE